MPAAKHSPVTGIQGNIIFCNFGATAADAARSEASLAEVLAGIRATSAEINGIVSETFTVHTEASALERDAAQLLLRALDSMDIVAFQSRLLLAGADEGHDCDAATVATSLSRFVSAGAAVSQRLHALVGEHRSWIGTEERVLRDIAQHAEQLEATAADCIRAMRAEPRLSDATV